MDSAIPFSFPSQLRPPHTGSGSIFFPLTLLHSERPKLYTILAFQSARGLIECKAKIVYNFGLSECKRVKSRSYFRGTLLHCKAIRKSQKLSSSEKMTSEYLEAPKHLKAVYFIILSVFICYSLL